MGYLLVNSVGDLYESQEMVEFMSMDYDTLVKKCQERGDNLLIGEQEVEDLYSNLKLSEEYSYYTIQEVKVL